MDAKEIQILEQAVAEMKEHCISMLYNFYEGCTQAGFDKNQSLQLTIAYMQDALQLRPENEAGT